MIHRNIEKSLHLLRVQIHRQHTAYAGGMQKIRDELGRDRHPRLIFAVLSRVTEKRNDRRDAIGAGAARGIHHDEQLHQVLVGRRAGRLNNENIAAANVFLDLDVGFAIGKRADRRLPKRHADAVADALRQLAIGGTAEDFHLGLESEHNCGGANLGAPNGHWQSLIPVDER